MFPIEEQDILEKSLSLANTAITQKKKDIRQILNQWKKTNIEQHIIQRKITCKLKLKLMQKTQRILIDLINYNFDSVCSNEVVLFYILYLGGW